MRGYSFVSSDTFIDTVIKIWSYLLRLQGYNRFAETAVCCGPCLIQTSTWKCTSQNQGLHSMILCALPVGNLCLKIKAWVPCCHSPCQPCVPDSVKLGVIFRSLLIGLHKLSHLHIRNFNPFLFAGMMFCDANSFASQCCLDVSPLGLPPFSSGLFH